MKVFKKTNNDSLKYIGEGVVFSKSQVRLNEAIDANIGMANGIQQAQMKAKRLMNQNPSVKSASADAGKLDGQNDANSGEGIKLELPINASGQQLAQAQRMAKDQSADDAQITFTKDNPSSGTNESRIVEMRKSAIPFTKKEMTKFLKEL